MDIIRAKIRRAENGIVSLGHSKSSLNIRHSIWESTYNSRMLSSTITTDVVIEGEFRGLIADKLAVEFHEEINKMKDLESKSKSVLSSIDTQINKLERFIDEQEAELSRLESLRASLFRPVS